MSFKIFESKSWGKRAATLAEMSFLVIPDSIITDFRRGLNW